MGCGIWVVWRAGRCRIVGKCPTPNQGPIAAKLEPPSLSNGGAELTGWQEKIPASAVEWHEANSMPIKKTVYKNDGGESHHLGLPPKAPGGREGQPL